MTSSSSTSRASRAVSTDMVLRDWRRPWARGSQASRLTWVLSVLALVQLRHLQRALVPVRLFPRTCLEPAGGLQPASGRRLRRVALGAAGSGGTIDSFDETDDAGASGAASRRKLARPSWRAGKRSSPRQSEDEDGERRRGREESVIFDPDLRRIDDMEGADEFEQEFQQAMQGQESLGVEVSDQEVEEFLMELNARPNVEPIPNFTRPVDAFGGDATKALDVFKELRMNPDRTMIYTRGLPDQQMLVTLKDRLQMLATYAEDGNWFQARYVMKGLWRKKQVRLPLGRILWNLMIKAHVRADRPKAAESWVLDMLGRVYQPDIISYNTLLQVYARRGDYLKAESWIRRMRARGVAPDMYTYSALVNAYVGADNLEGAKRSIAAMEQAGVEAKSVPYNAVLKLLSKGGNTTRCEEWLEHMEQRGIQPDKVSYLMMMKCCSQARDTTGAAAWLDKLTQAGLRPGRQHLHAVMTAHARSGDVQGTEAWMQVMRDQGIMPDTYSFNIWMLAASESGSREAVESIMEVMQSADVPRDLVTYSTIIGAFADAGDVDAARRWLYMAEADGLEPDLKCYNQALKACARAGNSSMAEHLTRRLLRNRLSPDVYTYNTLLNAFSQDGNPMVAEYWVDHMRRSARWRPQDFSEKQMGIAYAEVLLAHVRKGNLEAAEAWLTQMLGEGIEPDARCYIALAKGHLEQGRSAEAKAWCERMAAWSSASPPKNLMEAVYGEREGVPA